MEYNENGIFLYGDLPKFDDLDYYLDYNNLSLETFDLIKYIKNENKLIFYSDQTTKKLNLKISFEIMKYFYRHKTFCEFYYIDICKDGKKFLKSLVRRLKNLKNIESEDSEDEDEDEEESIEPRKACFILINNCTSQDLIDINIYSILNANSSFIIIYDNDKGTINAEQKGLLKESIFEQNKKDISSTDNKKFDESTSKNTGIKSEPERLAQSNIKSYIYIDEKMNQYDASTDKQKNTININTTLTYQKPVFKEPLSYNDFDIIEESGKGYFSSVKKAIYKLDGNIYVIKSYSKVNATKERELNYYREKAILYDLTKRNNPTIVELYADFEDNFTCNLVMEYVEGATLKNFRKANNIKGYVSQKEVINILTQILKTLEFLHDECHIIHRDINPNNIMVQKNGNIKLLDFGISAYFKNSNEKLVYNKSFKGNINYVAPEILLFGSSSNYDYKVDIFSLGFTMYNFMNPSNNEIDNLPQLTKKNGGNFIRVDQYLESNEYDSWLNDFVDHLSEDDLNQRPTAKSALDLLEIMKYNPKAIKLFKDLESRKNNLANINVLFKRDNYLSDNNYLGTSPLINISFPKDVQMENTKIYEPFPQKISEDLENKVSNFYLMPYITQENKNNKILSSMKCLLQILFQLNIFSNAPKANNYLFINSFYDVLNIIQQFQNGQIDKINYDKIINEFINKVIINNNSGISGIRPIILLYMITSIFKGEFKTNFTSYKNNICDNFINNNFSELNNIIPIMSDQNIKNEISNSIKNFKYNYKGPFVDNFYFIILSVSKCPECKQVIHTRTQIAQFLQLDVEKEQNNICDLINNYFIPKEVVGKFNCKKCGFGGHILKSSYCLNSPNYLILELEDKNSVNFNNNIILTLFNGKMCSYQYVSGIYKLKYKNESEFGAVIKKEINYYCFYSNDKLEQCSKEFINLENPSLVIYQKVKEPENNVIFQPSFMDYYNINVYDNNFIEMDKINIIFVDNKNARTSLTISKNSYISDLIKAFFERKKLPASDIDNYCFIYNAKDIRASLYERVSDIFKSQTNFRIIVVETKDLTGA